MVAHTCKPEHRRVEARVQGRPRLYETLVHKTVKEKLEEEVGGGGGKQQHHPTLLYELHYCKNPHT